MPEPHDQNLSSAIRTTSAVTLLSRLGGLAREVLTARIFGDTWIGSAFAAGFQVPNLFRRLFGEGALSAAFIPAYSQLNKHDPAGAGNYASLIVLALSLVTTALTIVIELGLLIAFSILPADPQRDLSLGLIMTMLPYMPLVCIAAIMGGMLQVHGKFGASSSGPIVMNTMVVLLGLYFLFTGQLGGKTVAYLLGIAIVISGFTQCFWFARLLRPHVKWGTTRTAINSAREQGRATFKKFLPAAVGLGTLQVNTFVDTLLAMWPIWVAPTILGHVYPMDERSNVLLAGAARLYQFPLGVFGIAVATAIFPLLSRHADEPAHFLQTIRRGIRLSLFIGIPASVGLFLVRYEAVAVPYSGGKAGFSPEGVARCAAVLGCFALAVWAYSLNHVLTRAFYAKGDTKTPMKVALAMVACNITLNCFLMWHYREAGLGWSTAICAALQCLCLLVLIRRHVPGASVLDSATIRGIAQTTLAAAIMGAIVFAAARWMPRAAGWTGQLIALAALSILGGIAYLVAAKLLRCHELGWLLHRRPQPSATPQPTTPPSS